MTKKKEERRELLKDDEIHSFLERSARYIQQNSLQVTIIAVGALVVLGGFSFWIKHLDSKRDDQARSLYQAEKILDTDINDEEAELKFASEKEKYEKALVALDEVIQKESGIVKQQAVVRKVGVLVNLGRQDEVEQLYRDLTKEPGLKFFGLMGLGDFYLAQKDYAQAGEQYEALLSLRGTPDMKDLVRYKKALCFKGLNELSGARNELNQVVEAYKDEEDASKKPPIFTKAQQLLDEIDKEMGTAEGEAS